MLGVARYPSQPSNRQRFVEAPIVGSVSGRMVGKPEVNHGTLGLQRWHAGLKEVLLHALSYTLLGMAGHCKATQVGPYALSSIPSHCAADSQVTLFSWRTFRTLKKPSTTCGSGRSPTVVPRNFLNRVYSCFLERARRCCSLGAAVVSQSLSRLVA